MKKFFKVVGIILLVLIVAFLVAGLIAPKTYHIERDVIVNASKEKVWPQVSSLTNMHQWNPWSEEDPNIKVNFEGQEGTVGSAYSWESEKVGSGKQTITKLEGPNRAESHIHFVKPFEGDADIFVSLQETGNATKVTWGFDTKYKYPMNAMLLFMNMDKMMGEAYDKGLANLKKRVESN